MSGSTRADLEAWRDKAMRKERFSLTTIASLYLNNWIH